MDYAGILLGLVLGVLLGAILGLQFAPGSTIGRGGGPLPTPPLDRDGYVRKADLEHIELRLEDAYDKLHHLYDRTRKRLKLDDLPVITATKEVPPQTIRDRKAAIRERLAARRAGQ